MKQVLFVCVHNSGRSKIAEAFFNQLSPKWMKAFSAGTVPSKKLNPLVVKAMAEEGIDLSKKKPQPLTKELIAKSDKIISMGCGVKETCPLF